MARSLGSLVVSLGLNAAEFVAGLTKAEIDAKKFARAMEKNMKVAAEAAGIALTAMAGAAVSAVVAIDQLAKSVGNFKDLEETTGANAEALASFSVSAAVAGTTSEELAGAMVKLTKNMAGVDDESSNAALALKALGINVAAFKQLDPASQFEEIAKALDKFKDGSAKTEIALLLLGKSGASLLPFFKELAAQGGRQVILTQAMIEQADNYADAQARARAQLQEHLKVIAIQALPVLVGLQNALIETAKQITGVGTASKDLANDKQVTEFATSMALKFAFWGEVVLKVSDAFQIVAISMAAASAQADALYKLEYKQAVAIGKEAEAERKRILARENLVDVTQRMIAVELARAKAMAMGPPEPPKPELKIPRIPKGGTSTAATEAERYIAALEKQIERVQDLTAVEETLKAIREGALKNATPAQQAHALALAATVDEYKELEEWIKKSRAAFDEEVKALKEREAAQQRVVDAADREAERIKQSNIALSEEIEIIIGGEPARKRLEIAHINDAIATAEDTLAQAQLNKERAAEVPALEAQIERLKTRLGLLANKDVAIQLKADKDALQALSDVMSDSFASSFEDFVMGTKSASQAFKDLANDIERYLLKIALHKLGDQMFGGATSGSGDVFGAFFKQVLGMFGGGSPAGWEGLGGFAGGTNYAPGGLAVVGEHGPEVVDMPRGARVYPTGTGPSASGQSGMHIENHFHVTGTVNSGTVRQIERGIGDSVARNRIDR